MPILDERTVEFVSGSPAQTQRLGARLGELLHGGHIICLEGNLGAGKTCLAQGIGLGWGAGSALRSPTFTLIHQYRRRSDAVRLYHIDMYRVANKPEAAALGLDELWNEQAVCLVEWPERIAALVPPEHLWIQLHVLDETRRRLVFVAHGQPYENLLRQFQHAAFGVKREYGQAVIGP
jgi:tRNA threonylcarbamoyladenosine biosynthesis protein TsaE